MTDLNVKSAPLAYVTKPNIAYPWRTVGDQARAQDEARAATDAANEKLATPSASETAGAAYERQDRIKKER